MKSDIANLFKWNTKVDIKGRDGETNISLYVRLVGDVDYNQAQQYGLLASRKLRKKLRDSSTVEHQSLFLDLDEREKDELIFGICLAEMSNFRDLAIADLGDGIFDIKLTDNPSLEDREGQQEAEEEAAKEKVEKLRAKMTEKQDERKVALKAQTIKDVRKAYVDSSVNYRCLEEFGLAFRDYCISAGAYSDSKFTERVFKDLDEFRNASPNLKRQLTDAYLQLELTGEQLKN